MDEHKYEHHTTRQLLLEVLSNQHKIMAMFDGPLNSSDEMERQAIEIFKTTGRVSVSILQSRMSIGFNRASRIMNNLEQKGIVVAADHAGLRRKLVDI